jgi:hypothetical protein
VTTDNSRSSLESGNRHQCKATNEPFFINVNIIGKRKFVTTLKWGKLEPFNFKSQQHLENEIALSAGHLTVLKMKLHFHNCHTKRIHQNETALSEHLENETALSVTYIFCSLVSNKRVEENSPEEPIRQSSSRY